MARQTHLYRVPLHLYQPKARNKAGIAFVMTWPDNIPKPAIGTRVYEVLARTHRETYEKLRQAVRPNDPRPIMGRGYIGLFVVRTPVGQSE